MSEWALQIQCPNGHRFQVPLVCDTCKPETPIDKEPRELTRREKRALEKALKKLEELDG